MARRELPETTGALAERKTATGQRRIHLTSAERETFQTQEMIERAVALYLDIYDRHSTQEIAEELGISVYQLRNLIRSEEFERVYNEHFLELGHDPRLQATRSAMVDLLPDSMSALKEVLTGTSNAAKVQAVKLVWDYVGLQKPDFPDSDRKEAIEFLKEEGIKVVNMNINLPTEYGEVLESYQGTMEGDYREVSDVGNSDVGLDPVEDIPDEVLAGDEGGDE
jgi:DNA-binding CsgD family transcriptional regulator